MTFKEQIMKLQTYKMYEDEDTVYVERKDILKLLEQQPCEDCISREAVLRLVEQYPNIIGNRCSGLIADIKHLPSVTPQRKRGKWLWELAPNGWANHICSECKFKENTDIHVKLKWRYCPKCGAEMAGDTDETN